MVRAGSPKQDATNFDPEFSFYLYQAYESIKSPLAWIQFIINMKQETARGTKTIISAMEDAELQMKDLECDGNWKPNDQDPEERMRTSIVAMLAKRGPATGSGHGTDGGGSRPSGKTPGNGNPDPKDNPRKSLPPFIKEPGKPGDTRTHNGKTFYYCKDPKRKPHFYHWVMHNPADCGDPAKMSERERSFQRNPASPAATGGGDLKLTQESVKNAMQALSQANIEDDDEAAASLISLLESDISP